MFCFIDFYSFVHLKEKVHCDFSVCNCGFSDSFNNLKCRLYCVCQGLKTRLFWTKYAKWSKLSKYTNPDCCALLKCRLHLFYEEKFIRGVLYQGYIYYPFAIIFPNVVFTLNLTRGKNWGVLSQGHNYNCLLFQIHQSLFHGGVFCHRDIFKLGDFILPNRSIAFFQGSFWFRLFWDRIVLYVLINQLQKTKGCFDLGYLDPGG